MGWGWVGGGSDATFHLLKNYFIYFLVGFKRNLLLLGIVIFSRGLNQVEATLGRLRSTKYRVLGRHRVPEIPWEKGRAEHVYRLNRLDTIERVQTDQGSASPC